MPLPSYRVQRVAHIGAIIGVDPCGPTLYSAVTALKFFNKWRVKIMRSTIVVALAALVLLASACDRKSAEEVTSTYPSGHKKETAIFQGKGSEKIRLKSFEYYDSGEKKKEFSYRDNLLSGPWTYWYKNGKKFGEGVIENKAINLSMVTGRETYYWPNGVKMLEAETVGGGLKPGSTAIFRDEAGKEYTDKGRPRELVERSKGLLERWERGEI